MDFSSFCHVLITFDCFFMESQYQRSLFVTTVIICASKRPV